MHITHVAGRIHSINTRVGYSHQGRCCTHHSRPRPPPWRVQQGRMPGLLYCCIALAHHRALQMAMTARHVGRMTANAAKPPTRRIPSCNKRSGGHALAWTGLPAFKCLGVVCNSNEKVVGSAERFLVRMHTTLAHLSSRRVHRPGARRTWHIVPSTSFLLPPLPQGRAASLQQRPKRPPTPAASAAYMTLGTSIRPISPHVASQAHTAHGHPSKSTMLARPHGTIHQGHTACCLHNPDSHAAAGAPRCCLLLRAAPHSATANMAELCANLLPLDLPHSHLQTCQPA